MCSIAFKNGLTQWNAIAYERRVIVTIFDKDIIIVIIIVIIIIVKIIIVKIIIVKIIIVKIIIVKIIIVKIIKVVKLV